MSEEILMNISPSETRVAIVENGVLQEVFIERANKRGIVGNIYQGKISRVLPGMQAAFVDVGLERTAFLHVSDISTTTNLHEEGSGVQRENRTAVSISTLVREGQEFPVQVIKDPLGSKGARLTTQISIPSRYLVFMPGQKAVGVSQKIEDEQERQRLKELTGHLIPPGLNGGFIVRTAAEGVDESALVKDMTYFLKIWSEIQEISAAAVPGTIIYEDLSLVLRILRDRVGADIDRVRIDSRETYNKALGFVSKFAPEMAGKVVYYPGERPIFDLYSVEDEIQKALERQVQLKSGGYLIFDQTEAMTTIDVNTGAFVGHRNLEETIFKTNLEAAQAVARQVRLRNLGGIIIIDFIDMIDEEHKRQVLRALEKYLDRDYARTHISGLSALGLVEVTRKRTRESLERVLCEPCPYCSGRGSVKTAETVCYEIFRELIREARQFDAQQLLVLVSQEVADRMIEEHSSELAELETFISKSIKFQVESEYTQEQFDVVLM